MLAAVVRYNSLHLGQEMSLDEAEAILEEMKPMLEEDAETIECEPLLDDWLDLAEPEEEDGFLQRAKTKVRALGQIVVDKIQSMLSPASATQAIDLAIEKAQNLTLSTPEDAVLNMGVDVEAAAAVPAEVDVEPGAQVAAQLEVAAQVEDHPIAEEVSAEVLAKRQKRLTEMRVQHQRSHLARKAKEKGRQTELQRLSEAQAAQDSANVQRRTRASAPTRFRAKAEKVQPIPSTSGVVPSQPAKQKSQNVPEDNEEHHTDITVDDLESINVDSESEDLEMDYNIDTKPLKRQSRSKTVIKIYEEVENDMIYDKLRW